MTSTTNGLFEINGVISTDKTALQNLEILAAAARSYLTFDINSYKWSVIINKPSPVVASFNDNNILGSISVSGTGLTEMYNRVQIEFPHKDMMDNRETILLQIPDEQRFPNEPDKLLNLSFDIINDPVQASMIALTELKQSRLDKVITFDTDFTKLGLKAGDVIDVTQSMYGFSNKKFRIISIEESDSAEGAIVLTITALEYDESVYDYSDIERYRRNHNTGIIDSSNNDTIAASDANANRLAAAANIHSFIVGPVSVPCVFADPIAGGFLPLEVINFGVDFKIPFDGYYKVEYYLNWGAQAGTVVPMGVWKISRIKISLDGGPFEDLGQFANTGDANAPLFEDHNVEGIFQASKDQIISYNVEIGCNFYPPFKNHYIYDSNAYTIILEEDRGVNVWVTSVLSLLERTGV